MRRLLPGVAALAIAISFAGCVTDQDSESTDPGVGPDNVTPVPGPAGYDTTGCTGGNTTGSGTGDITSDVACNETNATNVSG